MKIGLIGMKCEECGCLENYFDEVLGERVCSDCGLVLVTEIFEQTVLSMDSEGQFTRNPDKGELGSIIAGNSKLQRTHSRLKNNTHQRALAHCMMVLSNFSTSDELKERVRKVYIDMYSFLPAFKKYTYENRATAVVFYVLKEAGRPAPLKEVCAEFEVEQKIVKRILRKVNAHYRNSVSYNVVSPEYYLKQTVDNITNDLSFYNQCVQVLTRFESIVQDSNTTKSRSYYASICWITANVFVRTDYTRSLIAEKTGFDENCIYYQTRNLLGLIGLEKVNQLKGKDIEKIGE